MNIFKKIKRWFGDIVYRIKLERAYRKKLKEIKDEKSILIQQMLGENLPGVKLRFPNPMPQIEVTCEHTEF